MADIVDMVPCTNCEDGVTFANGIGDGKYHCPVCGHEFSAQVFTVSNTTEIGAEIERFRMWASKNGIDDNG